jgi:hypothetical protein
VLSTHTHFLSSAGSVVITQESAAPLQLCANYTFLSCSCVLITHFLKLQLCVNRMLS